MGTNTQTVASPTGENRQLIEAMDRLKGINFSGMTTEQTEKYLINAYDALKIICTDPAEQVSHHMAELMAILRNLFGLASDNKQKAHLILVNTSEENLSNLFHLFVKSSEHVHDSLIIKEDSNSLEEAFVLTLLRLLQVFHNLFNLYSLAENIERTEVLKGKCSILFEIKHLRLLNCIYEHEQADERLNGLFKKLCHAFTANMYCYLKNCNQIGDSFLMDHSQEMIFVWRHILNHVKLEISEWSLWIIFLGFKEDQFFQTLYSGMDNEYRLLLLDIVLEFVESEGKALNLQLSSIEEDSVTNSKTKAILPADCLHFMALQLKSEIETFLQLITAGNLTMLEEDNIRLISKLSSILCKISSMEESRKIIQQEQSLFELLVALLKNIQLLGKSNPDSIFSPQGQLKDVTGEETETSNPAYGFKRDIIGLIANFIYRNSQAQDYLRTSDGLAALLDCAKIDARNPFLLQWAIFAIRNALESNQANQQFIEQMNRQGILKDELVNKINKKNC